MWDKPMTDPSLRAYRFGFIYIAISAFLVRILYWFTTNWTIEDGMIIGRIVRNFANHGELSLNVGERVSTATSPLFALLAGLVASITSVDPLTATKSLGIISAVVTCLLLYQILTKFYVPLLAALLASIYVYLPPAVAYTTSGLETPLYILFCCAALERVYERDYTKALIWAAFAAITRPDGAIILITVGGIVAWNYRYDFRSLLRLAVPSTLILLLNFGIHYFYYEALFPQTVTAKLTGYNVDPIINTGRYLNQMLFSQPAGLPLYFLAGWAVLRVGRNDPRLLIFAFWYVTYHIFFMLRAPLFDWYLQVPTFVLCLFASLGLLDSIEFVLERIKVQNQFRLQAVISTALVCAIGLSLIPYIQGRINAQSLVEGTNQAASLWIAENASQSDLVFTEALGYNSYFNEARFIDWPGLTSREVPRLLNERGVTGRFQGYRVIIEVFEPDYLVLRNDEWMSLRQGLEPTYRECAQFPVDSIEPRWFAICRQA
jgi:hypothetical protein